LIERPAGCRRPPFRLTRGFTKIGPTFVRFRADRSCCSSVRPERRSTVFVSFRDQALSFLIAKFLRAELDCLQIASPASSRVASFGIDIQKKLPVLPNYTLWRCQLTSLAELRSLHQSAKRVRPNPGWANFCESSAQNITLRTSFESFLEPSSFPLLLNFPWREVADRFVANIKACEALQTGTKHGIAQGQHSKRYVAQSTPWNFFTQDAITSAGVIVGGVAAFACRVS